VIVRISSAFVPLSKLTLYLEHVEGSEIPRYEAALGLVSVSLLQRSLVTYMELMTISCWRSEEAMKQFVEKQLPSVRANNEYGVIQFEAQTYQLAVYRDDKLQDGDVQGTTVPE
jgi:heme-degrading monooxygenase HmoA